MRKRIIYAILITIFISVLVIINLHNYKNSLMKNNDRSSARKAVYLEQNNILHKSEQSLGFKHLLILFTTYKEIKTIPHHQFAREVALANWPSFKPYIQPVVFLNFTNSSIAKRARLAGWDVLPLTRVNDAGTPFLKDMYRTVFDKYQSMLYGFANGDILFDKGIIKTLRGIQQKMQTLDNNVLLTGRRTNVLVDLNGSVTAKHFKPELLQTLAQEKGRLIPAFAIDYFFFTKEGCSLNWSSLVDVVIGRPAYDSYLVGMALQQGVNVVDCTRTLLAVHISQRGVPSTGRRNVDARFNAKLIGGKFKHSQGYPTAAKLATATDFAGDVFVARRM